MEERNSGSEDEESDMDTDEELQEALASGLLKPGLNTVLVDNNKKAKTNNVEGLKQKLAEIKLKLPWIETLDVVSKPAPLAPELALQEEQHAQRRQKLLKNAKGKGANITDDPIHNDFKREMLFYRQAQATVLTALPRIRSLDLPTKRPEDYFAQMAKSDEHMQKVRSKLAEKQVEEERVAKVRKLRELKKYGKQVQIEVQQRRSKEKKDMLDQVKKFRKGKTDSIDFLRDIEADDAAADKGNFKNKGNRNVVNKRKFKDEKFGYGGKKKGQKANTRNSADDVSSYKPFRANPHAKKSKSSKFGGGKKKPQQQRPGKARRQNQKSKKR